MGTKGSAMLAMLTIHVNQQVSVDALTEAAWGQHVTAGTASTLLSHIWRLRQLLEPNRRSGQSPQVLLNDAGGYRLVGSPSSIDSLFFAESSARVRDQLAAGRLDDALTGADAALARWRGRPYGSAADAEWAQPAVARLDELRAQLQERRIAALLGLGALDTALSDLMSLIAALPFHEALRALQMEALHRSGRREQALEAFHDARRTLVDQVGIEPGRDLQILHRRILDDDPTLAGQRTVETPVRTADPVAREVEDDERIPNQHPPAGTYLPPILTPLIGRDTELAQLQQLVGAHRLVTISGPAGCGKTRLAVEVARSAAGAFDDGVWFVDLVAINDPMLVVDVVISTIGFVPSADATPIQDLKAYLNARRVLVVVDNCEHLLAAVASMAEEVLGEPAGVRSAPASLPPAASGSACPARSGGCWNHSRCPHPTIRARCRIPLPCGSSCSDSAQRIRLSISTSGRWATWCGSASPWTVCRYRSSSQPHAPRPFRSPKSPTRSVRTPIGYAGTAERNTTTGRRCTPRSTGATGC